MIDDPWRARLRHGGGAGAGSFLCVPQRGTLKMADGAWRIALRRRLMCPVEQIVFPAHAETQRYHSGQREVLGALLDGLR